VSKKQLVLDNLRELNQIARDSKELYAEKYIKINNSHIAYYKDWPECTFESPSMDEFVEASCKILEIARRHKRVFLNTPI